RFITQTASSTNDYYIQFSPDHSAAIANNDTFSIGPNLIAGTTNRVTSVAVDDYADYIYIGTTDADGTDGSVSKIALNSDTLVDVWHTDIGKVDDNLQPYGGASTTAISYADNTLVVSNNNAAAGANGSGGAFWSETGAETLDRKLTKPKTVFTVIDKIQVPYIQSPNGVMTFSVGSSTSLQMRTATTIADTLFLRPSKDGNILIGDDLENGLFIEDGGNVGIGTASPTTALEVSDTGLTQIAIDSLATTNDVALELRLDGTTMGRMRIDDDDADKLQIFTAATATQGITIDQSGNVGIGTTNPSVKLDVAGSIEYTGTITDVSDIRLKKDLSPLGSEMLESL
ncbi:MAG: hypothetical protein QF535_19620, partial [Anaerolineales bacterium]|nr:hypothetical protein [Anaerolineales bacterium]